MEFVDRATEQEKLRSLLSKREPVPYRGSVAQLPLQIRTSKPFLHRTWKDSPDRKSY